jgi:acyl carrier protein
MSSRVLPAPEQQLRLKTFFGEFRRAVPVAIQMVWLNRGRDRIDLLIAFIYITVIEFGLRVIKPETLMKVLQRHRPVKSSRLRSPLQSLEGQRVVDQIVWASHVMGQCFALAECLSRAAAAYIRLRRKIPDTFFVIGVAEDRGRLISHAWLERGDAPILEKYEVKLVYAEVFRVGNNASIGQRRAPLQHIDAGTAGTQERDLAEHPKDKIVLGDDESTRWVRSCVNKALSSLGIDISLLNDETDLLTLGVDSLGLIELTLLLEEALGLRIGFDEIMDPVSLGDLVLGLTNRVHAEQTRGQDYP